MSRTSGQVWFWPVTLAMFSFSGLVSALVFDGWGDIWSCIGLGVPAIAGGWFALPRRSLEGSWKRI